MKFLQYENERNIVSVVTWDLYRRYPESYSLQQWIEYNKNCFEWSDRLCAELSDIVM